MDHGGHLCVLASEESQGLIKIPGRYPKGKYVRVYDPIDGPSNLDANVSTWSVYGIYRRVTSSGPGTERDCPQPGYRLAAAAYVVYGASTIFVYCTGAGATASRSIRQSENFSCLIKTIRIPKRRKT